MTVSDNCDPAPVLHCVPGDVEQTGCLRAQCFTVRAVDYCGLVSTCVQTVTIACFNELIVAVQLSPTMVEGPIDRCITFELWDCGTDDDPLAVVESVLTFTNGLAVATVLVPCGAYDCITARDTLHTLRQRDDDFDIVGVRYVANFVGDPRYGGDWLIGGNLNDDCVIDILDFGVFACEWLTCYGLPARRSKALEQAWRQCLGRPHRRMGMTRRA